MNFEQIKHLYDQGFSLIPINIENKRPYERWRKYQKKRASLEQLEKWHRKYPTMNVAIIMQSSNLVVLDLESQEALTEIEKIGVIPKTVTALTGRFKHFYFKRGEKFPPHAIKFIPEADMIVSTYAIGVGSKHKNGKTYEWLLSPEQCDIAECPQWLIDFVAKKRSEKLEETKAKKKKRKTVFAKVEAGGSKPEQKHVSSLQDLTVEQRFKRSIKQLIKRKPEINVQAGIDLSKNRASDIYVNDFNRRFPKRNKAVPFILWDKKNEIAKKNGREFYITYGIVLQKSKNKVRQFGELIVNTFKKNGLKVQCNDLLSGRIRFLS
jgi:hypothetical protein